MRELYEELRGKLDCFELIAEQLDAGFNANQVRVRPGATGRAGKGVRRPAQGERQAGPGGSQEALCSPGSGQAGQGREPGQLSQASPTQAGTLLSLVPACAPLLPASVGQTPPAQCGGCGRCQGQEQGRCAHNCTGGWVGERVSGWVR